MIDTIQKTIVAWAFNQIAHYYFDNVNISQLHVALEKGEVELEDLIIKREALRHLKLPVDVTWGVVGKLTIKVPLLTILTDPREVKINIILENISIHLGPVRIQLEKCNLDIQDEASNSMQLVVVDCDKCLFYIVDDTNGSNAIPMLEFSLEDFRILLVLSKNQRNGFVYGTLGCCYYNRELSTWDPFLEPWPFNLSWQFDLTEEGPADESRITFRKISMKSDEIAEFYLTAAFLDICDVYLAKRFSSQAKSLFSNRKRRILSNFSLRCPGLKLTLLDNSSEKLIKATVESIVMKWNIKAREEIIDCSIQNIRIENLMAECEKSIMLDRVINSDETVDTTPAIRLIMDRIVGKSLRTSSFEQVQLSMCEFVLNIEERLIVKLIEFMNFRKRRQKDDIESLTNDLDKILHLENDRSSKYYFDLLSIDLSSIRLSVITSPNSTKSLQRLKTYLGIKSFGFEDAQIQLAPYLQMDVSRNFKSIFESVTRFYRRQIIEQTPRIIGQQVQNYLWFSLPHVLSTIYDEVYDKLFY